jgi:hypothetical protein
LGVLSPKAIPQMQDTAAVLGNWIVENSNYWLLLIPEEQQKWLEHAEIQFGNPFRFRKFSDA